MLLLLLIAGIVTLFLLTDCIRISLPSKRSKHYKCHQDGTTTVYYTKE